MDIKTADWDLIQLQYEVLNESIKIICQDNDISEGLLHQAISDNGWARPDNKVSASTDFVETVEQKATYISTHRQKLTAPIYTKIEYVLLSKSLEALKNVDTLDRNATSQLKAIAVTLDTLLKHNDILSPSKEDILETTLKHLEKMRNESDEMLDKRIESLEAKLLENVL